MEFEAEEQSLEDAVRELQEAYELPRLAVAERDPPGAAAHRQDRLQEWREYLFDLGYLAETDDELTAEGVTPALRKAIARFHMEAAGSLPGSDRAIAELAEDVGDEPGGPVMLQLLADLMSFDGETPLRESPRAGQRDLLTRVLHFRLCSLGLYSGDVAAPAGTETFAAVALAERLLGAAPDGEGDGRASSDAGAAPVLELLGDIRALIRRVSSSPSYELLLTRGSAMGATARGSHARFGDIVVDRGRFRDVGSIRGRGPHERTQKRRLSRLSRLRGSPQSFLARHENQLGVRLLQIRLWSMGAYTGRLDGIWSDFSRAGLVEALKLAGVDPGDVMIQVDGGAWLLNFAAIARDVLAVDPDDELDVEASAELLARDSPFTREEADAARANGQRRVTRSIWDAIRERIAKGLALGRRISRGVKSMARSAVDGLRKGYHWIRERFDAFTAPVVSFFKMTFRGVREGVRLLASSIRTFACFVLGRPFGRMDESSGALVVSRFSALDRDATLVIAPGTPPSEVMAHARECLRLAGTLEVVMILVGKVLFLVIRGVAGPPGWVRVGIRLGASFYKLARRDWKLVPAAEETWPDWSSWAPAT